ncbi:hypothetical protein Ciccas_011039, partial [Cichlidogyrus casuarinus]
GYRVLDLSRVLAGPFCTMLLGDMGAEVIKIEQMAIGDPTRGWGPPFQNQRDGKKTSIYFQSVNRNKKSVALDFTKKEAQNILHSLVEKSDILVENYIPGGLAKHNLDYKSISAINPNLIYCSITGYGQTGPSCKMPGYDLIAASQFGLLSITGPSGGEPCRVGVAVSDLSTGLFAKSAILGALVPRKGGNNEPKGCHIDVNLMSSQIAINSHVAADYLNSGEVAGRIGTAHRNLVPYKAYMAADKKYLIIGTGSDAQFEKLASILGHPEWAEDKRFCTNAKRVNNREKIDAMIQRIVEQNPSDHWFRQLANSGIPNGPVNSMPEVFRDPQLQYHKDRLILSWTPEEMNAETGLKVPGKAISL